MLEALLLMIYMLSDFSLGYVVFERFMKKDFVVGLTVLLGLIMCIYATVCAYNIM